MTTKRHKAYRLGLRAETLAALWLRLKGYRIDARRVKTPVGELDLIARRGRVLVFIEVKARPTLAAAKAAITPRQQHRIIHAAQWWLQNHHVTNMAYRFDAICIASLWSIAHIKQAWTADHL